MERVRKVISKPLATLQNNDTDDEHKLEPILEEKFEMSKSIIIKAVRSFMSPQRLSILLGISELKLRNFIMQEADFLKELRYILFDLQTETADKVINYALDKKNATDFLSAQAEKHFDTWSRFLATDIEASSDMIIVKNAIKGGIGTDLNFWKNTSKEILNTFATAMQDNENYVRMFFDVVEGMKFELGIQHKLMFDEFDRVSRNETNVLIVNIAPRLGKSTTLYAWVTKMLMTVPNFNVVYTSYGEMVLTLIRKRIDVAFQRWLDKAKTIPNPFYKIFDNAKSSGFDRESDFMTEINSQFFSATMLGGVTGRGASAYGEANGVMAIDDPHNANDVGTVRIETTWTKFQETWLSRMGSNPLILIMQRLCVGDLTDKILDMYKDSNLNIRVLTLPIEMCDEVSDYIAKQRAKYPKITFIDPARFMNVGDTLLPKHKVEQYKQMFPEAIFKTQYLQIPTTYEGLIFKSKMFHNTFMSCVPVLNHSHPNGFVNVLAQKRVLREESWQETNIIFEGVFLLHIDTTSGNTDTSGSDVDDCVWSVCIAGLKERKDKDNAYGAILYQYALNSKLASDIKMQEVTTELIRKIYDLYNINNTKKVNPYIIIAVETHSQGGGLASYIKGLNINNVCVISYSRQNYGNKKDRFIRGSGFYEDRIFWYQGNENVLYVDNDRFNEWYFKSRMQHLMVDGERTSLHDDYIEAGVDLGNLWLSSDGRDRIYQTFLKERSK